MLDIKINALLVWVHANLHSIVNSPMICHMSDTVHSRVPAT